MELSEMQKALRLHIYQKDHSKNRNNLCKERNNILRKINKRLNSIRKTLSTVALHRIRDKIDKFTGPYQSGFKRGRSRANIVWAQCILISVVMIKHWDFYKMGIDMSRAFDTIKRSKILEVLDQAGCNDDKL
ncbi:hypothetical protein JOB18_047739 [Solea senegalensis]|uniref:Reverse transcriptase domain-containing protein n=1 Tax=Solea senegalensis TaxID=28829 RepID=A0AAV6SJC3_SOLSE|nr:hypothetical protein JOB18_047739 [Solea senegalensis]